MRKTRLMLAVTGLVLASAVWADDKAVRKEMESKLNKAIHALVEGGQASVIEQLATSDYTVTDPNGTVRTRADVIKAVEAALQRKQTGPKPTVSVRVTDLKVKGNTAASNVVTTIGVRVPDTRGELGPAGKVHLIQNVGTSKITWVKDGGGWKMKKSVRGAEKILVDGKPAPVRRPAGKTRA